MNYHNKECICFNEQPGLLVLHLEFTSEDFFFFLIECNGNGNSNAPKYFTCCRDAFGPFNELITMHEPASFEGWVAWCGLSQHITGTQFLLALYCPHKEQLPQLPWVVAQVCPEDLNI